VLWCAQRSLLIPYTTLFRSPAGVDAHGPLPEHTGADGDGQIEVPGERHIADHSPVDPATDGFELVDDLQRPGFGRTGQRSGRERSEEHTSELQSRFDLVWRL